jgi:hypothetical protein
MRKVQTRKFAKVFQCSAVIRFSGSFGGRVMPEMNQALVDANKCSPSATFAALMDALKFAIFNPCVLAVLSCRAAAKILPSIIQSISVAMIAVFSRSRISNKPVHCNAPSASDSMVSVTSIFRELRLPRPIHQPFVVFGIDYGGLALCEWDKSVRLIEWLGYFVSGTKTWHRSSAKGFVLPGHFTLAAVNCE